MVSIPVKNYGLSIAKNMDVNSMFSKKDGRVDYDEMYSALNATLGPKGKSIDQVVSLTKKVVETFYSLLEKPLVWNLDTKISFTLDEFSKAVDLYVQQPDANLDVKLALDQRFVSPTPVKFN